MEETETTVTDAVTTAPVTNRTVRRAMLVGSAIVVGIWLALIAFWGDAPFALSFDDAWYYLTIGRNLANGNGSTFDGINLTNGYHPLWQMISVVPFLVGLDDLAAGRALLAFQLVVGWGATLALMSSTIARVLRSWPPVSRRRVPIPGADRLGALTLAAVLVLIAASPFVVKIFVNGLESGIAATCYAALLYLVVRNGGHWVSGPSTRWRLAMSTLLSVTFLARTDAVLGFAALGVWCIAEAIRMKPAGPVRRIVELFALPALVIAGYSYLNLRLFGTPQQISGLVKRAPLDAGTVTLFGVFVAAAVAVGWLAFRASPKAGHNGRFPMAGMFAKQTGWFASFCVLLVGYYNVLSVQQWLWYYAPVALYLILLLVLGVADMAGSALTLAPEGTTAGRALLPVQAIMGVILVGLLAYTGPQFFDPNLRSIQIANASTGTWMRQHLPDNARIASWDAGALGYFSHRPVINIDGVVNSYQYYEAGRTGNAKHYWDCIGLQYVANLGVTENGEDKGIREFIRDIDPSRAERSQVVHREPFTYTGVLASSAGTAGTGDADLAVTVYRVADAPRC